VLLLMQCAKIILEEGAYGGGGEEPHLDMTLPTMQRLAVEAHELLKKGDEGAMIELMRPIAKGKSAKSFLTMCVSGPTDAADISNTCASHAEQSCPCVVCTGCKLVNLPPLSCTN
jgi:hypothetical protein